MSSSTGETESCEKTTHETPLPTSSILRAVQIFNRDHTLPHFNVCAWAAEFNSTPGDLILAIGRRMIISRTMAAAAVEFISNDDTRFAFCRHHELAKEWWRYFDKHGGTMSYDHLVSMLEVTPAGIGEWWEMTGMIHDPMDRRKYLRRSGAFDDLFAELDAYEELSRGQLRKIRMLEQANEEQHATIIAMSSEIDELDAKCAEASAAQ